MQIFSLLMQLFMGHVVSSLHLLKKRIFFFMCVRLNLINHLIGLFRAKFACNLAISNPVFMWESCNGSVWESVKKCSRLCSEAGTCGWISRLASRQKMHTSEACREAESSCQL